MKLQSKKNGKGYITSYIVSIGTAEARSAGFIDESGVPKELEKTVDCEKGTITFRVKADEPLDGKSAE